MASSSLNEAFISYLSKELLFLQWNDKLVRRLVEVTNLFPSDDSAEIKFPFMLHSIMIHIEGFSNTRTAVFTLLQFICRRSTVNLGNYLLFNRFTRNDLL